MDICSHTAVQAVDKSSVLAAFFPSLQTGVAGAAIKLETLVALPTQLLAAHAYRAAADYMFRDNAVGQW